MNHNIDGKMVSIKQKEELIKKIRGIDKKLTLAVISVGMDPASEIYISKKAKMAFEIGYNFLNIHFDTVSEEELINKIQELNNNSEVTGIIVQLPLPEYLNKDKIINMISPSKDVDGLTDTNLLKLIHNEEGLTPCTPKGILTLLDYYNIPLAGKNVVMVGRSRLVGLPLFHLLLNRNATMTICHSKTIDLKEQTQKADILIVAAGKKGLITEDMIKKDCIIVDVGINRVNNKIYGDVSKKCEEIAKLMTPVPGGVGPMTVISLMENVYNAYLLQEKEF